MALANYTDLLASMAGWLNREDLTARLPDFVSLAEADFNRQLRVAAMVRRSTSTLAGGEYRLALPSDWLEAINIQVTGSNTRTRKLEYVSPGDLDNARAAYVEGYVMPADTAPLYYNLVGGSELEVTPAPVSDATIEMLYYASIPALATNATNWLLTSAPDAYLYGSLLHAAPYLDDDARIAVWQAGYSRATDGLQAADERAKHSGGPLKRRFSVF